MSERWEIVFEIDAAPTVDVSVAEMAGAASDAMLRVLVNELDLWPTKWHVRRVQ